MTVSSILEAPAPMNTPEPDTATAATEQAEHLRTQFLRRVAHDIASPTGVTMTVLDELANADKDRKSVV